MWVLRWIAGSVLLSLVGCTSNNIQDAVPDAAQKHRLSTLQSFSDFDGFEEYKMTHGGFERHFWVHVPEQVQQAGVATSLALFFHGFAVTPRATCRGPKASSGYFAVVPEAGDSSFIAVCLQGTAPSGQAVKNPANRGWNNEACCGHGAETGVDDVGFTRALLDYLRDDLLPNTYSLSYPPRVYAFGFSTGGLFTYRLACELPDYIDGIGPSGATFGYPFGSKKPITWPDNCQTSVSVWNSLGTNDKFTNSQTGLTQWRKYSVEVLGCAEGLESTASPQPDVSCHYYSSCGLSRSELCLYTNAAHAVPPLGRDYNHWHLENAFAFLSGTTPHPTKMQTTPHPTKMQTTPQPTKMQTTAKPTFSGSDDKMSIAATSHATLRPFLFACSLFYYFVNTMFFA